MNVARRDREGGGRKSCWVPVFRTVCLDYAVRYDYGWRVAIYSESQRDEYTRSFREVAGGEFSTELLYYVRLKALK